MIAKNAQTVLAPATHDRFSGKGELSAYLEEKRLERWGVISSLDESRTTGWHPLGVQVSDDVDSGALAQTGVKFVIWAYSTKKILQVDPKTTATALKTLLGSEWCETMYPKYRYEKGDPGEFAPLPEFDAVSALDDIQRHCEAKGLFDARRIYRAGVYAMPEGGPAGARLAINTGSGVFDERGRAVPRLLAGGVFEADPEWAFEKPFGSKPLSEADANGLLGLLGTFGFVDRADARLALGWLALGMYGGALRVRPHMFLTGPRAGGKSTLMMVLAALGVGFGLGRVYFDGKSSPAGLTQHILTRPASIYLDEFEKADPGRGASNAEQIYQIMTSSYDGSQFLRGTAGGRARSYHCLSSFCVSAINLPERQPGLATRSVPLYFQHSGSAQRPVVKPSLHGLLDEKGKGSGRSKGVLAELGLRLFGHMLSLYGAFESNRDAVRQVLQSREKMEARFCDTVGSIMAAEMTCRLGRALSEDEAAAELARFNYKKLIAAQVSDEANALSHLLSIKIEGSVGSAWVSSSLADTVFEWHKAEKKDKEALEKVFGVSHMRPMLQNGEVWMAVSWTAASGRGTQHDAAVAAAMGESRWSQTYRTSLENLLTPEQRLDPDFTARRVSFGGIKHKCVLVRMPIAISEADGDDGAAEDRAQAARMTGAAAAIPGPAEFDALYESVCRDLAATLSETTGNSAPTPRLVRVVAPNAGLLAVDPEFEAYLTSRVTGEKAKEVAIP